jgi:hypothetical protein
MQSLPLHRQLTSNVLMDHHVHTRKKTRDIMKEESNRTWWADNGRAILAQLLVKSDKDPQVQTCLLSSAPGHIRQRSTGRNNLKGSGQNNKDPQVQVS